MGIPFLFFQKLEREFQNSELQTKEHISLIARQERRCRIQKETNQHQEQNQKGKTRIKLIKNWPAI